MGGWQRRAPPPTGTFTLRFGSHPLSHDRALSARRATEARCRRSLRRQWWVNVLSTSPSARWSVLTLSGSPAGPLRRFGRRRYGYGVSAAAGPSGVDGGVRARGRTAPVSVGSPWLEHGT